MTDAGSDDVAVQRLDPRDIEAPQETQPRLANQLDVINEYAELMADGVEFPPVEVRYDGERYILSDGFHRRAAAIRAGLREIAANVRPGTLVDAIEDSAAANKEHGLRREKGDKRRAVEAMFRVEQLRGVSRSDREIARHCGVNQSTVSRLRAICCVASDSPQREITRNGTTYLMNTERIGVRPPDPPHWQILSPPDRESDVEMTADELVAQMPPQMQEALAEATRQTGVRMVVGEVLADAGKHINLARGEIGTLVRDLGLDAVRAELDRDRYLEVRCLELAAVAGQIATFARAFTNRETEVRTA